MGGKKDPSAKKRWRILNSPLTLFLQNSLINNLLSGLHFTRKSIPATSRFLPISYAKILKKFNHVIGSFPLNFTNNNITCLYSLNPVHEYYKFIYTRRVLSINVFLLNQVSYLHDRCYAYHTSRTLRLTSERDRSGVLGLGGPLLYLRTRIVKQGKNTKYSAAKIRGAATSHPNICKVGQKWCFSNIKKLYLKENFKTTTRVSFYDFINDRSIALLGLQSLPK